MTGLRRKEIASMTPESFKLDPCTGQRLGASFQFRNDIEIQSFKNCGAGRSTCKAELSVDCQ